MGEKCYDIDADGRPVMQDLKAAWMASQLCIHLTFTA